jgi:hypothetical protein
MAKVSDFFVEKEQQVAGHIKGIIEDVPVQALPFNALADGYNVDFYAGYDKIRQPIIVNTDLQNVIPAGYILDNFYFKDFTDKTGNKIECCIAGFKKAGDRYRIYINKWYNPGSEYCNDCDGDVGWQERWVEITEYERLQLTDYVVEYRENGNPYNFAELWKIPMITGKPSNYYKGFYVYDTDYEIYKEFQNRIVGIVVKSDSNNIYVRRCVYRTDSTQSWGQYDGIIRMTQYVGAWYTLVRYPWTAENKYENTLKTNLNYDNFKQVSEIGFSEINNAVCVTMGHAMRPMWIGFIPDRKYFGNTIDWNTQGFPDGTAWKRNFDGFWSGPDIANVQEAGTLLNYSTTPEVIDMRKETAEMGIALELKGKANAETEHNKYAVAVQYDGYQAVRVKYIYATLDNIRVHFRPDSDKRITGFMVFHEKTEDIFNNPYLLPIEKGGITDITEKDIELGYDLKNAYTLTIAGILSTDEIQYGISINNYFNCTFDQQKINLKAKILTKLENNLIAGNISPDSFLFSSVKNYDLPKCIALSQIQNLELSAYNVFGESRFLQPVKDEIKGIAVFNSNYLAIWTSKDMAIYSLTNPMEFKISNIIELANRGTYNQNNVCAAQTDTYFGGLYWVNQGGIYCFKNNNVTEITGGFWKVTEFDKLSETDKANIKIVYKPSTNEIICYLNYNFIYIYEINEQRWRKYQYPSAVTGNVLQTAADGEVYIGGDNTIYKTTNELCGLWKDIQDANNILDTGVPIQMKMVKRWNYGTELENLLLHKIKIHSVTSKITDQMGYDWGRDYQLKSGCSYTQATKVLILNANGIWANNYYKTINSYWIGKTITIMDLTDINNIITYYKPISEILTDYSCRISDDDGVIPDITESHIRVMINFIINIPAAEIHLTTNTNFGKDITIQNGTAEKKEIIIPPFKRQRKSYIEMTIENTDGNAKELKIKEIIETTKKAKDRQIIK